MKESTGDSKSNVPWDLFIYSMCSNTWFCPSLVMQWNNSVMDSDDQELETRKDLQWIYNEWIVIPLGVSVWQPFYFGKREATDKRLSGITCWHSTKGRVTPWVISWSKGRSTKHTYWMLIPCASRLILSLPAWLWGRSKVDSLFSWVDEEATSVDFRSTEIHTVFVHFNSIVNRIIAWSSLWLLTGCELLSEQGNKISERGSSD
jgi:hypothetical protein